MKYLALLFLVSCGWNYKVVHIIVTPKFQPGDCISHVEDKTEFSDTTTLSDLVGYRKITKIGKKVYQYEYYRKGLTVERDIDITDKFYVKVDCPAGV